MNPIAARENFKNAVMIFENAFKDVTNVVEAFKLTQSSLRIEQPISATTTLYPFPILKNQNNAAGTIFNTELRLNMQDTFVPTEVGLFVALPTSSTDAAYRLHSYPNQAVFANAVQMRTLYNGQLIISVNNYQYTYSWDAQRHWVTNQTQATAAFGPGSPEDQNNFADDGFYPMQPYVLFGGAQNVEVSLRVPVAPTAVDANSRLIAIFRGVLGQNSTPVS